MRFGRRFSELVEVVKVCGLNFLSLGDYKCSQIMEKMSILGVISYSKVCDTIQKKRGKLFFASEEKKKAAETYG